MPSQAAGAVERCAPRQQPCPASLPGRPLRGRPPAWPRSEPRSCRPPGDRRPPGAIGSLGFLNSLLVLVLFCRSKALRSPVSLLLRNIPPSGQTACALGTPFGFATSARRLVGCVRHGFANALFGTVLLIFLAVLSYECYCTMMGTTEVDTTNYRKIWMEIVLSWTYSLFWTVPPLFGRNSYGPEGPGTTCSVNWHSKDANNVSYIICLFIFCFVIPFVITVYLYGKLLSYTVGK